MEVAAKSIRHGFPPLRRSAAEPVTGFTRDRGGLRDRPSASPSTG